MTLDDIFIHLSSGELMDVAIGNSQDGLSSYQDKLKLVSSITLGLNDLYKRFLLKEVELTIPLVEGQLLYQIEATDFVKVERIKTGSGTELSINNLSDPYAVRLPSNKSVSVPELVQSELKETSITLVYRARHPEIDRSIAAVSPEQVDIELPDTHLEALLLYVASRVLTPIGMTSEYHDGNNYYAKYEAECAKLLHHNYVVDTLGGEDAVTRDSWC